MAELDSIDYLFVAPSSSVHRIQEAQTTTYHVLWELTATAFQGAPHDRPGGPGPASWSPGSAISSWATTASASRWPAA